MFSNCYILRKPKIYLSILGLISGIVLLAVIVYWYETKINIATSRNDPAIENSCNLVKITNGQLKGQTMISSKGQEFQAFLEIPFAKPPIGELRFKSPVPPDNWNGVLDATNNTKTCFQWINFLHIPNFENIQTEDCLYLNVYTPVCPSAGKSLPVMFYIYGSGFLSGTSDYEDFKPNHLMDNDIVVVTSNYRLGPFGFLSTGDEVIPGNYGMKDHVMALKWVQENIEYFGGDPKRVSIVGHSSGAVSVSFLLLSKLSKGLYTSAVSLSGSFLNPWSYQKCHRRIAFQLAAYLDDTFSMNNTSEELLEFLRGVPARAIRDVWKKFLDQFLNDMSVQGLLFTPVIEPEHEDAFITESMYTSLKEGKIERVPLLIGMASEEALGMMKGSIPEQIREWKKEAARIDANHAFLVLDNMNIIDDDEKKKVGEAISDLYPKGSFVNDLRKTIRYSSETAFDRAIIRYAELQSNFNDVYFCRFSYFSPSYPKRPNIPGTVGVGHGDENIFLWIFDGHDIYERADPMDLLTSERYRTLITNFIKYSNPTPHKASLLNNIIWPKVQPNNFQFLDINETLTIQTNPMNQTYRAWVEIYEKMARKPLMTF